MDPLTEGLDVLIPYFMEEQPITKLPVATTRHLGSPQKGTSVKQPAGRSHHPESPLRKSGIPFSEIHVAENQSLDRHTAGASDRSQRPDRIRLQSSSTSVTAQSTPPAKCRQACQYGDKRRGAKRRGEVTGN